MKKNILILILLFAFSFGIECYAGSPFLPYKQNDSFYSKLEIISAYKQKEIYLERLAFRIEQVARHDGWANQISLPLTKAHALYFLNRMEEGEESWEPSFYDIDGLDEKGRFFYTKRPSYSERSSRSLGPEGVLFLDPAKAGIKGEFPKRSLIARVCGNTKSGVPARNLSLKEESPLVSSPMLRSAPAPSVEPKVNLNTNQSEQVWVKQSAQVIPVYSAKQQDNSSQQVKGYYEPQGSNCCCGGGYYTGGSYTIYGGYPMYSWGGYPWVTYGGGRTFYVGGSYGALGGYTTSGWYGGNSYQTAGSYGSGGWYGNNSYYSGNGAYPAGGSYNHGGGYTSGGVYTGGGWYNGGGGYTGGGSYNTSGYYGPRGPR